MKQTTLSLALLATLPLFASSVNLDKVTVTTASKTKQSFQSTTANVDILTQAQMQERGFITVSDALRSLAGISINRNGGLGKSTTVRLRGSDTQRILVLVDGVRYNNPTSSNGAEFAHLMVANIEKIEVVKGAQSGVWGADASAGVINIITKKATSNKLNASLFAEYGSYNTQNYGISLSQKVDRFDIAMDISHISNDGFSAQVPEGKDIKDFEDDGYKNTSLNFKAGFDVSDKDRLEGFFNMINADTEYDGYNKPNDENTTSESKQKFYGLSYTKTLDFGDATLYAQRSKFERNTPNGFTKEFDGSIDEVGLKSKINYLSDSFAIVGIEHRKTTHENAVDKSFNNDAIFIANTNTLEGLISGKTTLATALRYDKFDTFKNKLTYKVGVKHIHENIKDFWTSANYATAYNAPAFSNIYGFYGNPNITPENTTTFDVTANYKNFGITYFDTKIEDMIGYDFATSKYANLTGKTKLQGVEVSYNTEVEAIDTLLNLNYTYLKTEDKDGKDLLRRPKNSANIMIDYYGLDNAHLGTQIRYVGERDALGDKTSDAYTLVRLNGDYDLSPTLNLYMRVENALDKSYQDIIGYGTSQRAFYAGFRYKLQ